MTAVFLIFATFPPPNPVIIDGKSQFTLSTSKDRPEWGKKNSETPLLPYGTKSTVCHKDRSGGAMPYLSRHILGWEPRYQKTLGKLRITENKVLQWGGTRKVKHKCDHLHCLYKMCLGLPQLCQIHPHLKALECNTDSGMETGLGKEGSVQISKIEPPCAHWVDVFVKTPCCCQWSNSGGWGCCISPHENSEGWNKSACLEESIVHKHIDCLVHIINIYRFTPGNMTCHQRNRSQDLINIDSSKPSNTAQSPCLFPILH